MKPEPLSSTVIPAARRVPEPYLRAEIAAFPLSSEAAFRTCLLELDPMLASDSPTRELWRACEDLLAQHTGWSLDRLVTARDRGWFGVEGNHRQVPMHRYLRALARSHLVPRAGVTEIQESTALSALDAASHYRWLTLAMPESLLLGALGVEPAPLWVAVDPPLLIRRLLDSGIAEIHQHAGAGMGFPLLWASALAAIATPAVEEHELKSPGAPFSDGEYLVRWLLAAAVARCALAEFLIRGRNDSFAAFVNNVIFPITAAESGIFQTHHIAATAYSIEKHTPDNQASHRDAPDVSCHRSWTLSRQQTLLAALAALVTGNDKRLPNINPLRDLYGDLHPSALTLDDDPIMSVEDAFRRCDPIAVRLELHGNNAGERWLLHHGLAYLNSFDQSPACTAMARQPDGRKPFDAFFARVFWQTMRVYCQYYRTVVERPMTGGLQWFIRFYGRLGELRRPIRPILAEASYNTAGAERHRIRALELRSSSGDTSVQIGEQVLGYLKSWQRVLGKSPIPAGAPEFGVVFHFVKVRDVNADGAWSHGVPPAFWANTAAEPYKGATDVERGRYVHYFAKQCRKARALAEFIQEVPSCLWVIRGLDVATDELGVPTWILVPLFRHVLDEAALVSILKDAGPPLGVTAHVGEDFRHLLEGMRRIYEHVHYILGASSGRLGHAIALGVDARTWAESVGSVLMPAEERLWDLVWEWRMYTQYRIRPEFAAVAPPGRVDVLCNQVRILIEQIYPNRTHEKHSIGIEHLAEAHHWLHRFTVPPFQPRAAVDGGPNTFVDAADMICRATSQRRVNSPKIVGELLKVYVSDESTFQRGQTLIDVPVRSDEVDALNAIQDALRRGISYNGIVIEVNPSSNLMIGDLLDLRNHPILRLMPPVSQEGAPPPVAIAIGSDDPVTFSTQLMHEYTLLHQTARTAGYSERDVQEWLELIRRTGMDARFTVTWTPDLAVRLIENLSHYLHLPNSYGRRA